MCIFVNTNLNIEPLMTYLNSMTIYQSYHTIRHLFWLLEPSITPDPGLETNLWGMEIHLRNKFLLIKKYFFHTHRFENRSTPDHIYPSSHPVMVPKQITLFARAIKGELFIRGIQNSLKKNEREMKSSFMIHSFLIIKLVYLYKNEK